MSQFNGNKAMKRALLKVDKTIFNIDKIAFINLSDLDSFGDGRPGVTITFVGGEQLYFSDEEAEVLRYYFNHPTSDVVDLVALKG